MLAPSCFLIGFVINKVIPSVTVPTSSLSVVVASAGPVTSTTGWLKTLQRQSGDNHHSVHNITVDTFCDILINSVTTIIQNGLKSSVQLY